MKKLKILIVLLLAILLQGCMIDDAKYINLKEKPSLDYYTKSVYKELLYDKEYTLQLFDRNYYKNIPIENIDNNDIIEKFIASLVNEDYREITEKPSDIEPYQLKLTFNDSKYVIKVYSNTLISIAPWDGVYEEDVIDMTNVPVHFNLYDYCEHIKNSWVYNQ